MPADGPRTKQESGSLFAAVDDMPCGPSICAHTEFECDCDCDCGRGEQTENCMWPDCLCGCRPECKGCAMAQEASGG